jgi:hypothetical protein
LTVRYRRRTPAKAQEISWYQPRELARRVTKDAVSFRQQRDLLHSPYCFRFKQAFVFQTRGI